MTWLEDSLRGMAQQMDAVLGKALSDQPRPGEVLRPGRLLAAMRHGSLNGGKRLRPLLMAETAAGPVADRSYLRPRTPGSWVLGARARTTPTDSRRSRMATWPSSAGSRTW